jgi:hypothetical protein
MAQPIRRAISIDLDMLYLWGVHKSSSFGRNLDVPQLISFIHLSTGFSEDLSGGAQRASVDTPPRWDNPQSHYSLFQTWSIWLRYFHSASGTPSRTVFAKVPLKHPSGQHNFN